MENSEKSWRRPGKGHGESWNFESLKEYKPWMSTFVLFDMGVSCTLRPQVSLVFPGSLMQSHGILT